MKCTFSAREPNILMEAQPGDLFVPLGPDLVECVCAVRTIGMDGARDTSFLDPAVRLVVTVIGCRIEKGEPEYYPSGYTTSLPGATPISFLEQVEPAAFRERMPLSDATLRAMRENLFAERVAKHNIKCRVGFADGGFVPFADAVVDRIAKATHVDASTGVRTEVPISRL